MHITVFGASGGTGRLVVRQALKAGHDVTAVVRDGSPATGLDGATLIRADVMDPVAIAPSVAGRDAVVSAIGTRTSGPTSVCYDTTCSITSAMRAGGVSRLVVVSQALVTTDGDGPFTRVVVKPLVRRFLRHALADAIRMEEHLRTTDLDWTIVRPPRLTNGKPTGRYQTARGASVRGGYTISRADLATAILATLDDAETAGTAVGVAH